MWRCIDCLPHMGEFQLASSNYHRVANQQEYTKGHSLFEDTYIYKYWVGRVGMIAANYILSDW